MTLTPAALLEELAAIQRDVKTLAIAVSIARHSTMSDLGDRTLERIGLLMSTIAALPPVGLLPIDAKTEAMVARLVAANTPDTTTSRKLADDNDLLAPVNARLDALEKTTAGFAEIEDANTKLLDHLIGRLDKNAETIAELRRALVELDLLTP